MLLAGFFLLFYFPYFSSLRRHPFAFGLAKKEIDTDSRK